MGRPHSCKAKQERYRVLTKYYKLTPVDHERDFKNDLVPSQEHARYFNPVRLITMVVFSLIVAASLRYVPTTTSTSDSDRGTWYYFH